MGLEAALVSAGIGAQTAAAVTSFSNIFSVIQGVSSLVGGFQSNAAADAQAQQAIFDAQNRGIEAERQAFREAGIRQEQADDLLRRQKLAFIKSGVTLAGSPLIIMEQTRTDAQDDIDEILAAGRSSADAALAEGRLQADQLRNSGRQSFISGLTGAGGALASVF